MKKSMKIVLVALLLLANCGVLFAQQAWLELGDKYFDQFAYKKAIKLYEGAIERGLDNWEINAKLGDCYYNTSDLKTALKYYEKAIGINNTINETYLLKYALCLQSTGGSEDRVIEAFQTYYEKSGKTESIRRRDLSIDSNVEPENLSINSAFSDFGTFIFNNKFYFASSRENPDKQRRYNKRLYKWNEQPFLDIYEAEIEKNTNALKLVLSDSSDLGENINTNAHQASVAITKDGKTMYFSGGKVKKNNKLEYDNIGTSKLRLQRASLVNNKWEVTDADKKAMEFFDFENFSIGNPTLSPDNKRLFFVTCAPFPEAMGHTDIYYVDIMDDGTYGNFKYIPGINTSGRESFPFISSDGTLYFSSDGIYDDKPSLGLLDIYKVEDIDKVIKKEKEAKIIHLGNPFNSVMDDFAFFMEEPEDDEVCEVDTYFSSNRQGGLGEDDIYRVKIKRSKAIQGTIKDKKNGDYIKDATVELIDSTGMVIKTVTVDSTGIYNFDVECDKNYKIRGSMPRYYDDLKKYHSTEAKDNIDLELMPFPCEISINHIEFALDSANIRVDAKNALSKLKDILISNPDIKIRIESYTDSRGPAKYNLVLSERRAQNTKLYLINAGVNENQITSAKGFGEKCLIVSDEEIRNLSSVDERNEAHQKNRRSLFILDCKEGSEGCQEADQAD